MQELSSLFMTHRINAMHALIKFPEYIPYGLGVMARTRSGTYGRTDGQTYGMVYSMELTQGAIIQIRKMQELFSLFMTHHINVMHALVKFREYIPYSLGVMARSRLTILNLVKGK